jgi:hypothetical protein
MKTNLQNRSRRVARKIADVINQTKSLEQRIKFIEADLDLNPEERNAAIQVLRNRVAQVQTELNAYQRRAQELPLPVVPTNMSTNIQTSIFRTECMDEFGRWTRRRNLARKPTTAARPFRILHSAYAK